MSRNAVRTFSQTAIEGLGYYVYRYVDPRNGETFYVGKGQGNRLFAHLFEAEDLLRQSRKVERIREIWSDHHDVHLVVHRHNFRDEQECAEAEACLIDTYPDATNEIDGLGSRSVGAASVDEINSIYDSAPAQIDFPAVLIKINREWSTNVKRTRSTIVDHEKLYNATRTAWAIDPNKRKHVLHAISVAMGIVREVYIISTWMPADIDAQGLKIKKPDRWMFEGKVDASKAYLIGKSVAHLQSAGAQNPIAWFTPDNWSFESTSNSVQILGEVKRTRNTKTKTKVKIKNSAQKPAIFGKTTVVTEPSRSVESKLIEGSVR